MAKPKRIGKGKKANGGDDAPKDNKRQDVTDAAIMECFSEIEAIDQRIAGMREKRTETLDKFKKSFGISKGAFQAAYRDAHREGADKATHISDYLTCAKAMGVMADLPLGDNVLAKMRTKAEKMAEKEAETVAAAKAATEREEAAFAKGEEPAVH